MAAVTTEQPTAWGADVIVPGIDWKPEIQAFMGPAHGWRPLPEVLAQWALESAAATAEEKN